MQSKGLQEGEEPEQSLANGGADCRQRCSSCAVFEQARDEAQDDPVLPPLTWRCSSLSRERGWARERQLRVKEMESRCSG
jgi:hypothetical protein